MYGLPPIGAEIPCSALAINTPIQLKGEQISVDLEGGMKHRVDVNPDDPTDSVCLRLVGFRLTPYLGVNGEEPAQKVTIEQSDVDVDAKSVLRKTQEYPPKFECELVMSPFTMTVEGPGENEPMVLITKTPAVMIGQLTQFPPRRDLFQLKAPVDLVPLDDPYTVIATIQKLPMKVGFLH